MANVPWGNETERADYWKSAWNTEHKESERYRALGTVEELAALKEAAERIVLMWDNCYIEPYSADVKDYIERMRKAIKEADNDESGN